MGLCDAESTTPRSAPVSATSPATAGVGRTPASSTSTPALARPATTAAARNSPEARGSRPTIARGRCPAKTPTSPSTWAAATARSRASSAVTSRFAVPRTPSVPKSRPTLPPMLARRCARMPMTAGRACHPNLGNPKRDRPRATRASGPDGTGAASALAVLRSLAGLLEAGLLALLDAGVARQEAGLLERGAVGLEVDLVERAGHAEAQRAGLAGRAAAVDAGDHVEAALEVGDLEGVVHQLLVHLVGEVLLQGAAVDLPRAGARDETHAGDGLLAAAGGRAGGGDARTAAAGLGRAGAVAARGVLVGEVALDLGAGLGHCSPSVLSSTRVAIRRPVAAFGGSRGRQPPWAGLLGDLRDLEGLRLLRRVRVLRAGVHLRLGELLAAQGRLGDHPTDGLLDRPLRMLVEQLHVADRAQTARVARVPVRALLLALRTREGDLAGVDDDDEVTGVDVRGEDRLVLAAEERRDVGGESPEDDVGGVDHVPAPLDIGGGGGGGGHKRSPRPPSPGGWPRPPRPPPPRGAGPRGRRGATTLQAT